MDTENQIVRIKKKYPVKKCPHGKSKYICINCGGKGICIHGKVKYRCRLCGGSGRCIHDKEKATCKYCDWTTIDLNNSTGCYTSHLKEIIQNFVIHIIVWIQN